MSTKDAEVGRSLSRRGLLKAAGLGAGAASVAAASLAAGGAPAGAAAPSGKDRAVAGYRETEHVKAYYARTRL